MRINHFTLLVAPILVSYSNFCIANLLSVGEAIPRIAPASVGDTPEPTCNPAATLLTTHGTRRDFSRDCIAAANQFYNIPWISSKAWHWKRHGPGARPLPGYNFLPFAMAPKSCMIELDVLSDPDAEDQLALADISEQFRAIFRKCVAPRSQGKTGGFVPVGPRQVLKLSVLPTPTDWVPGKFRVEDKSRLNMTTFSNEISGS